MAAFLSLMIICAFLFHGCDAKYQPNWESIDSRPVPQWFDDGKIGVMIHFGVFSVPSFSSEWFWYLWKTDKKKDIIKYMKDNFKPDFTYADFGPMFTAEFFDANKWVKLFEKAGAKYTVLTAKHHEGFTNWPSKYSFSWNSVDVGPNRDIVGEFAAAIRNRSDIRLGIYHSLFEFYNPLYLQDVANNHTTREFVKMRTDTQGVISERENRVRTYSTETAARAVEHKAMPEMYELINTYKPDLLWSDGDWMVDDDYWDALSFLTWLYNDSPVKDTIAVNDRWGKNCRCKHGGYLTCHDRYNPGVLQKRKWENVMTMDRTSAGYRREAVLSDYFTMEELVELLVRTVSCGGNLLMNVGPRHDGMISPIFEERLLSLGEWLDVNGEAIYKTRPWDYQNDTLNPHVWYTKGSTSASAVYAITLKWPVTGFLSLGAPVPAMNVTTVELLGYSGKIPWSQRKGSGINIRIPMIPFSKMPCKWAWVFKLNGLKDSKKHVADNALKFEPTL